MTGLLEIRGRLWRLSPCWAVSVRGRTAGELSGIIHRAWQRFHFRRGVLDPGGGGDWVLKELWKPRQYYDGREHDVTGLCTPEQANLYQGAMPILVPLRPKLARPRPRVGRGPLPHRGRRHHRGDPPDCAGLYRKPFRPVARTARRATRKRPRAFDAEQRMALAVLTLAQQQLLSIKVVVDADATPRLTKRGFLMFRAEGKRKRTSCTPPSTASPPYFPSCWIRISTRSVRKTAPCMAWAARCERVRKDRKTHDVKTGRVDRAAPSVPYIP